MDLEPGDVRDAGEQWSFGPQRSTGADGAPDRSGDASAGRIVVVVVAYEAEAFIEGLLNRIPPTVDGSLLTVLVADDASADATVERSRAWAAERATFPITILRRSHNLGYGGNQKASFRWALDEGFDVVVLLHGDEQYPPERIGDLVAELETGRTAAAYGTRMSEPGAARRGGMPLDRFVGNRVLSSLLNRLTGASLTEWFNGFRAYRSDLLRTVDLPSLPDGFDFDTAITVRTLAQGHAIAEVPMPTRYADEISRVPLLRTGIAAIRHGMAGWRARR